MSTTNSKAHWKLTHQWNQLEQVFRHQCRGDDCCLRSLKNLPDICRIQMYKCLLRQNIALQYSVPEGVSQKSKVSFAFLILQSYTIYLSLGLRVLDCQQNSTNGYILIFHHNDFPSSIQSLLSSDSSFIMQVFFCIVLCAGSFWVAMSFVDFWNVLSLLSTPDIYLSFIPGTNYHPL